jgi:hypothetical protein
MLKPLLLSVLVAQLAGQSALAAQSGCDGAVDASKVRIHKRPLPNDDANMPVGDRSGYHDADALVTCRTGEDGSLTNCEATLSDDEGKPIRDDRATWVAEKVSWRYKLLDREADGCPLAGRSISFKFHFDMEFPPRVWEVE